METNIWFELSKSQLNIWDLEQRYPGTPMNAISCTIEISGKVDFALLSQVLNQILQADDSLRLRIQVQDKVPMQSYTPFVQQKFEIYDFTLSGRAAFEKWQEMAAREPISVCNGPLCQFSMFRLGEFEGGILVRTHHIISDGWTQMQLCNRIASHYMALLEDASAKLDPQPSYLQHIENENKYLDSFQKSQDDKFWRERLGMEWDPAYIKQEKGVVSSLYGMRASYGFTESLNHKIYHFCMENRVSPFSVYYLALAAYLNRSHNLSCFSIGVPVFNRVTMQERETTGMFVSTLPFICRFDPELTTMQLNESVAEQWFDLLRHQRMPMHELQKIMQELGNQQEKMFDIALSYEDTRMLSNHHARIRFGGNWYYSGHQVEQLCIHLHNRMDDRHYQVDYDFQLQLFSEEEIAKLHEALVQILDEMLSHPNQPVNELDLLPQEERERVLYTFNATEKYVPEGTLGKVLSNIAEQYPAKAAVICDDKKYTYQELYRQAFSLAVDLECCFKEEQPVIAIVLDREYGVLKAMSAAMIAGCPWVLISPKLPAKRIQEVLSESKASVIVTRQGMTDGIFADTSIPVYDLDNCMGSAAPDNCSEEILHSQAERARRLSAYLVYTSGTTGKPKGVEVTQAGLLNFAAAMEPYYGNRAVLSVCNIGFDAYIIESAAALLNGRTIVLAKDDELQDASVLAGLIRGYGVGFLSLTPSRLKSWMTNRAFCQAIRDMQTIICGGEPFPAALVSQIEDCSTADIYNQYGPSEATVGVSMKRMNRCRQITIGAPMANCRMYVLNEKQKPLPVGARGTLYLSGRCLAAGYYGDKAQTEEKFVTNPFEWKEKMYNTGDEAAWTESGEVVLFGRNDHQVKLRGLRIDLQEIRGTLELFDGVSAAYVKLINYNGQDCLAAYYVSKRPLEELKIRKYLSEHLPGYMVPSFYQWMPVFDMTDNGKIDERCLPMPEAEQISGEAKTRRQKVVLDIFAESLHAGAFGMDNDYFRQGGNSLGVMEVISHLNDTFGVKLKPSDMYAYTTPRLMEQYLAQILAGDMQEQEMASLQKAPVQNTYPMTATQQNMFVQCQMSQESFAYHMPGMFCVPGGIDVDRLQKALDVLSGKDDILRTGFRVSAEGPEQIIYETSGIQVQRIQSENKASAVEQFLQPFDLSRPPLVHCGVWRDRDGKEYLMLDIHHMIGDGISTPLFLKRLDECYQTGDTFVPEITFKDYAYWQQVYGEQDKQNSLNVWEKQLDQMPELLLLPTDKKRSGSGNREGAHLEVILSQMLSEQCSQFCKEAGCSEYVLFAAAFGLLLKGVGQVDDLIVGTPLSGRERMETHQICGPFVNTLPLRIRPKDELSVAEYISQINNSVRLMLDHQSVTLEDLIALKHLPRTMGGNPMYQILFSMRPLDAGMFGFAGVPIDFEAIEYGAAKMDLGLEAAKENGQYKFVFEYATALFSQETVAYYGSCLEQLIKALVQSKAGSKISAVASVPAFDQITYFEEQNETSLPFSDMFLDRMIERYSQKHPEQAAIIWHGEKTTYGVLQQRIHEIYELLLTQGVKVGDCIGLMAKRTPDMIAAMIAILRAGAAYVPALATFPENRLQKMEQISQMKFWLCDSASRDSLTAITGNAAVLFDDKDLKADTTVAETSGRTRKTTDNMYVLFTSGSTGEPKGITVTHRGVHNLSENIKYLLTEQEGPALCTTNMVFDTFYTETLLALRYGKTIVLADEEEMMLPWKVGKLITEYRPALMQMTPSRLSVCLEDKTFAQALPLISKMVVAGEALTPELVSKFKSVTQAELINLYGPAEASVYATGMRDVTADNVTIGKPLCNCRCYCLDENRRPVPPTAIGELYLAGECLGNGYLNQNDLTRENFFEDPFAGFGKMYRTRDLVRYRLDGNLEFVGRVDFQVKLNGQRLEPDEIAMVLRSCESVGHAVVVPVIEEQQVRALRAYYELSKSALSSNLSERQAEKEMKESLGRELPAYMMPSEFICLEALPLNANGKVDRRALMTYKEAGIALASKTLSQKPLELEEISRPVLAEVDLEDLLLCLWEKVLKKEQINREESFFEQGGTSLSAMQLLSCYYDQKLTMTMEQFYQNQAFNQQLAFFQKEDSAREKPVEVKTLVDHMPKKSVIPAKTERKIRVENREKTVLISGVTGFLGAHLLEVLLKDPKLNAICLVRLSTLKKLYTIWSYYFGREWTDQALDRVELVPFDLSDEVLGLKLEKWKDMAAKVTDVYHCAADVRHFCVDGQITKTNYEGTQNLVAFAKAAGAVFHHVSTLSVCGTYLKGCPQVHTEFEETDFEIGQNWQDNEYVRSKFLAEQFIRKEMERGLEAKIYRVGTLVGRSRDGRFQINPDSNAFFNDIIGMKTICALPEEFASRKLDLTPIDYCAAAIVALAESDMTTMHIMGTVHTIEDLCLDLIPEFRFCQGEAFEQIAAEKLGEAQKANVMQMRELLARFKEQAATITPVDDITKAELQSLGFAWDFAPPELLLREFYTGGDKS